MNRYSFGSLTPDLAAVPDRGLGYLVKGHAVRTLLVWMLILHMLHLPIPFPDLDGECRGTPIQSLSDANAWHVMLIGVRPNDDIDRGPIRTSHEPNGRSPGETPFGDPAAVTASAFDFGHQIVSHWHLSPTDTLTSECAADRCFAPLRLEFGDVAAIRSSQATCIRFCSWQV